MTAFLASVASVAEAKIALEAGADIIDLKNPADGALGALPVDEVERVVRFVDGRRPLSATIGDLPMVPQQLVSAVERVAGAGVDIIKVGFFAGEGQKDCVNAMSKLSRRVRLVAVLFAELPVDSTMLPLLADCGFYGAMMDTANKSTGNLCTLKNPAELQAFVTAGRAAGLVTGLAGSLRARDVAGLASMDPDYLGFRGALCTGSRRESGIDAGNVKAIATLLCEYNMRGASREVLLQN